MSNHLDPFQLLKASMPFSNASLPLEEELDRMIQLISGALGSDRCLFLRPDKVNDKGFLSHLARDRKPLWVDEGSSFQAEGILPEEEPLICPSFACIPLYEGTVFQGILYIGFSKKIKFSPEEVDLFLLIAKQMEATIRIAHVLQKEEQHLSELTALHEIGKIVTSTLNLDEFFKLIATTGLKVLKAKAGVLRIMDQGTKELRVHCSLGDVSQNGLDERIAKRVCYTRTPLLLNHSGDEKPCLSILCTPLLSKDGVFGTLAFYDKEADASKFDEWDFQLLLTMADQISCAIENAMTRYEISATAQKYEKRLGDLSTLWELNKALMTTVNFERILDMTLTAVTIGEGLRFNRAMLFLINEKNGNLEGAMAVGPDSGEEAGRIWAGLSKRKGILSDLITQLPPKGDSLLNSTVKGIRIPLEKEQCILSRTVLEGRSFNVRVPQSGEEWLQTRCEEGCHLGSEVGCYVGEHLSRDTRAYSFATVPLWGKGKVIGVILVDNLYNQSPITEEDIHFLTIFSNQAGLAIENALLYRNLEEIHQELRETQNLLIHREKMAALGELSNSVAHEIKNPLTSIGGFARRLERLISTEGPEKRYTQTITKEVVRLEKILSDILNYTHDESMIFKKCDFQKILKDSLSMISEGFGAGGIQLVEEFDQELPQVNGDDQALKQACFNLIENACQAMKGKGTLILRASSFLKDGSPYIKVEVEDTGKGINPADLHHIFNPFYTTKASSLGLGLPFVHKIITSHRGEIEVDNHPGKGVNFIITLPAAEEGIERFRGL
jgi:two-component system sensor histidine kinase HydH